ncbi:MAG: heme exporter protein CcmD [Pseudomonas sp.]
MSYLPYVIAAYAVFVLVLAWDFLAARWQVRRALRMARTRRARPRGKPAAVQDTELAR